MLKYFLILTAFIVSPICSMAQMEDYTIYSSHDPFSSSLVDIRKIPPVKLLDFKKIDASCISDSSGNLKLYLSSDTVYDAKGNLVFALPYRSLSYSSLFVPKPECPNVYYLFVILWTTSTMIKYFYFELDLNKTNAHYLVTAQEMPFTYIDGGSVAVTTSTLDNYWLMFHGYSGLEPLFIVFQISKTGVHLMSSFKSYLIPDVSSLDHTVFVTFDDTGKYVSSFDASNSVFSKKIKVESEHDFTLSPDGTKLYSISKSNGRLVLTSNEIKDWKITKKTNIFSFQDSTNTYFAILPNGLVSLGTSFMDSAVQYEIVNPNASPPQCFVRKRRSDNLYFSSKIHLNPHPTITLDNYCLGKTRLAYKGVKVNSVEWDFGDGQWQKGDTVYHDFDKEGDQTLKLKVVYPNGKVEESIQYFYLGKRPTGTPVLHSPDFSESVCENSSLVYTVKGSKNNNFLWTTTDSIPILSSVAGDSVTVSWSKSGVHHLSVTEYSPMGCPGQTSSVEVQVQKHPQLQLASAALCSSSSGGEINLHFEGTAPWQMPFQFGAKFDTIKTTSKDYIFEFPRTDQETDFVCKSLTDLSQCKDTLLPKSVRVYPFPGGIGLAALPVVDIQKHIYSDELEALQSKVYSVSNPNQKLNYQWHVMDGTINCLSSNCDSIRVSWGETAGQYLLEVRAISANGCVSDSAKVMVNLLPLNLENVKVPNVFTPNGDGVNDEFKITVDHQTSFSLQIYNRWGQQVFESKSVDESWNGKLHGSACAAGSYFYVLTLKAGAREKVVKGFVVLER